MQMVSRQNDWDGWWSQKQLHFSSCRWSSILKNHDDQVDKSGAMWQNNSIARWLPYVIGEIGDLT